MPHADRNWPTLRRLLSKDRLWLAVVIAAAQLLAAPKLWGSEIPGESARGQPLVFDVGAASVDITPDFPVRLNGFGFRRTESEGVTERIYAKALAISRVDQPPAILVTADILGFPADIVGQIAARLEAKAGVERERLGGRRRGLLAVRLDLRASGP